MTSFVSDAQITVATCQDHGCGYPQGTCNGREGCRVMAGDADTLSREIATLKEERDEARRRVAAAEEYYEGRMDPARLELAEVRIEALTGEVERKDRALERFRKYLDASGRLNGEWTNIAWPLWLLDDLVTAALALSPVVETLNHAAERRRATGVCFFSDCTYTLAKVGEVFPPTASAYVFVSVPPETVDAIRSLAAPSSDDSAAPSGETPVPSPSGEVG